MIVLQEPWSFGVLRNDKFLRGNFNNIIDHIIGKAIGSGEIYEAAAIISAQPAACTDPDKSAAVLVNIEYIIIHQSILDRILVDIGLLRMGSACNKHEK